MMLDLAFIGLAIGVSILMRINATSSSELTVVLGPGDDVRIPRRCVLGRRKLGTVVRIGGGTHRHRRRSENILRWTMTLSLDDVRNKRFRMARKSGYEVVGGRRVRRRGRGELSSSSPRRTRTSRSRSRRSRRLAGGRGRRRPSQLAEPQQPRPAEPETIVVTTGTEASSAVVRLVELSTEQAERLVNEATEDATGSARPPTARPRRSPATPGPEPSGSRPRPRSPPSGCRPRPKRADTSTARSPAAAPSCSTTWTRARRAPAAAVPRCAASRRASGPTWPTSCGATSTSLESGRAEPYEVPALADRRPVAEAEQRSADTRRRRREAGAPVQAASDRRSLPSRSTRRPSSRRPARRHGWTPCSATSAERSQDVRAARSESADGSRGACDGVAPDERSRA